MYSFSYFLEAVIGRNPIPMDQDDIAYLSQFPKNFWIDAIKQRYNNLLLKAITHGISDPVTVQVRTSRHGEAGQGGIIQVPVHANMDRLVTKLKNLGYDLSDPHPETETLSNMKLMNREQATTLIRNWLSYSNKQGSESLVPGFARFTPTKLERGVQSYDNPYDDEYRSTWAKIKQDVETSAKNIITSWLSRISKPTDRFYINSFYWNERQDEVLSSLVKRIQDNLAHPDIMDKKFRNKLMAYYLSSLQQTGHISRRVLERAKKEGINIPDLIKKGYTIAQIINSINNAYMGSKHGQSSNFSFNIGKPQQQDYLKSIHQSAETPGSAIANYGKRTIGSLRQDYSQKAMQNPALQNTIGTYRLAPETQPQPMPRRRAAKDISDLGFKDWANYQIDF